jgi:hypothetical protein
LTWGQGDAGGNDPANLVTPAAVEDALAAAVKDPDRVTALLDELSRGRRWLPLPDARPVTEPHIVVPAAELARRMPAGVGIALNPGAETSVPIYPEGVGYLAAARRPGSAPSEVRSALGAAPAVRQTSQAWLSVRGQDGAGQEFPIDVTFPGEGEPDQVDARISDHAEPFYIRA